MLYLGHVKEIIKNNDGTKGNHARVKIIAEKDGTQYNKISDFDAKEQFKPKGCVFCPCFYSEYNTDFSNAYFVEFEIKQSEKENQDDNDHDVFIMEYHTPRPRGVSFPKLVKCDGILNMEQNSYLTPQEVTNKIDTTILESCKGNFYIYEDQDPTILYGPLRYQNNTIISTIGTEIIKYNINTEAIFECDGQKYLLDERNNLEIDCKLDFMTDQQLTNWFSNRIENFLNIDRNILSTILENPENGTNNDDIDAHRFDRVDAKIASFTANLESIINIIDKNEDDFREEIHSCYEEFRRQSEEFRRQSEEQKQNTERLQNENDKLNKEIAEKEERKVSLNDEIIKKENQLKSIKANYDSILATISVAVPLFENSKNTTKEHFTKPTRFEFEAEGQPFSQFENEHILPFMKRHLNFENEKISNYCAQVKTIFSHKACFIPNSAAAYLFAKALRNTVVFTMHVEYDWLHFSDFCNHGLLEVFEEAKANPSKNFIILFDGINNTQPECGLRPLLNLINDDEPYLVLESGCIPFPNNITIMATILSAQDDNADNDRAIGLKLHKEYFRKWYALGTPQDKIEISLPKNFTDTSVASGELGYICPDDLMTDNIYDEDPEGIEKYCDF